MTVPDRATATQRSVRPVGTLVLAGAFVACLAVVAWSGAAWLFSGTEPGVFVQRLESGHTTSFGASVRWGIEGSGAETAVLATIDIPDQRQRLRLAIRPNNDPQFPASHVVEMTLPPVYTARSIASVSSLIVKARREDAGRPLIGAVVDVSPDTFWMALSAVRQDREANLAMLASAGVFQLNMTFADGATGVLAFEKGASGEPAFQQAIAAWRETSR